MSFKYSNAQRDSGKKGNATSITASQRSTCNVVIFPWQDPTISKLTLLDTASEKIVKGVNGKDGNLKPNSQIIIKNDVIRCSVTKNKSGNAGQFQLTLKRGKKVKDGIIKNEDINYLDIVNPGDWIMIYIKKGSVINTDSIAHDSGLKMIGIIDNVRYVETDDEATGKPRLEYIITGQDFGKVFGMDVSFNPLLSREQASSILGAQFNTDSGHSLKGVNRPNTFFTPDEAVRKLASFYLGGNRGLDALNVTNEAWYIPTDLALKFKPDIKERAAISAIDIMDLSKIGLHKYSANKLASVSKLPGGALFKSLPSEGTVWSVLQFAQNKIANEMYTELVRGSDGNLRPSLILRQIPYSNRPKQETNAFLQSSNFGKSFPDSVSDSQKTFMVDLPQMIINSSDIKEKNVGKSDFERINHLLVVPRTDDKANMDKAYKSVINVPSIQRYGLSSFKAESNYVLGASLGDPVRACKFYVDLLVDWFFLAHQFYNGTIVISGQDRHFQVGDNLYISDVGQLYHIEGYNHTYEVASSGEPRFNTTLTVSRGQSFRNNQAQFIGPTNTPHEPTSITSSVLEGIR